MQVRKWNVLSWNIWGINSDIKWNAIRDRLCANNCDILCLQETKRDNFDPSYLRNFCPPSFDDFAFLPSVGASGGSIIVWNSAILSGNMIFQNGYAVSIEFTSLHTKVT